MFKLVAGSIVLILVVACAPLVSATGDARLVSLSKTELCITVGGGCQYCKDDGGSFCTLYECRPAGSGYDERTGSGATKAWCWTGNGTCRCNQDNIPHVDCLYAVRCSGMGPDGKCTGCGTQRNVTDRVQSTCNPDGQCCSQADICYEQ
jgi:hypothetical protein